MAETLSVYRSENKYWIEKIEEARLQKQLDQILQRDNHSKEHSYIVRSLYFDSLDETDYLEKLAGVEIRKKIRIRTYDPNASRCKLEVKKKFGNLQNKISLWITKEDAISLTKGEYDVLIKYFDNNPEAVEIYSLMRLGLYRPCVLIEYDRIAYTYPRYRTRITFDQKIRATESCLDLFAQNPMYHDVVGAGTVLEVKYDGKLMRFISQILKTYNITQTAISKYVMSRQLLTN